MAWMRYNRMANNSRRPTRKHGRSSFMVDENIVFSSLDQIIEIGPLVRLIGQKLIIVRSIFDFPFRARLPGSSIKGNLFLKNFSMRVSAWSSLIVLAFSSFPIFYYFLSGPSIAGSSCDTKSYAYFQYKNVPDVMLRTI